MLPRTLCTGVLGLIVAPRRPLAPGASKETRWLLNHDRRHGHGDDFSRRPASERRPARGYQARAAGQEPAGRPLGAGVGGYGERSPFETTLRRFRASRYDQAAGSLTPLQGPRRRHHAVSPPLRAPSLGDPRDRSDRAPPARQRPGGPPTGVLARRPAPDARGDPRLLHRVLGQRSGQMGAGAARTPTPRAPAG